MLTARSKRKDVIFCKEVICWRAATLRSEYHCLENEEEDRSSHSLHMKREPGKEFKARLLGFFHSYFHSWFLICIFFPTCHFGSCQSCLSRTNICVGPVANRSFKYFGSAVAVLPFFCRRHPYELQRSPALSRGSQPIPMHYQAPLKSHAVCRGAGIVLGGSSCSV